MASGSYAKKSMPQQQIEVDTYIPPRRTRLLPETFIEEVEPETSAIGTTTHKTIQIKIPPARGRDFFEITEAPPHPLARYASWLKPLVACMVITVLFITVLLTAAMFQRPGSSTLNYSGGSVYTVDSSSWRKDQPLAPKVALPPANTPYSVLGQPSITVDTINRILAAYNSPAAGKGQKLYDLGIQYQIDPAFALAFFMHESTFGKNGVARESLSLGNLRCYTGSDCRGGYAYYPTWEDGFESWYQLIRNYYVAVRGLTTVDKIIPVYAPQADNNNEQAYISSLKHELDVWRSGGTVV